MQLRIRLTTATRKMVIERLQQAYRMGELRLIKRIHALLAVEEGRSVEATGNLLALSGQAVRNYLHAFLNRGIGSLAYQRPPGRPPRLNKSQRRALAALIEAGPAAAGYDWGCWTTVLIADLIHRRFGVMYSPHYVAELLGNMGFSYQKARFVSDHLDKVADARHQWLAETWPTIKQLAEQTGGMILFGDEASFAQWGSLSYTWARRGQQPAVKTSGLRKAYKVFGLIDYLSGAFFYQGHEGKFNADSYQAFLLAVLRQTNQHLILIQDGARYHTSRARQAFFAAHADRLTVYQLPSYSPDFNPIEFLWRNLKKQATHLRYFPTFTNLIDKVEEKLSQATKLPTAILALMGLYCQSLGAEALPAA